MEIFKEKEEAEVVKKSMDPENGLEIESSSIDYSLFGKKGNKGQSSVKAKAYKESHANHKKSELDEMDTFKHLEAAEQDLLTTGDIPKDFEEALISVEELIEFLDNNEEQIDV